MEQTILRGGFSDPARQAAVAFRAILSAMARPGQIETVRGAEPPAPLSSAAGVVLLTLCDGDTPVFLADDVNCKSVQDWIRFHIGAPLCGAPDCAFAVGRWSALQPLSVFPAGTSEYPDRSATLVVECQELINTGSTLSGPGIQDTATLSLPDEGQIRANQSLFPRGVDFIFTSDDKVAALPRSTKVL